MISLRALALALTAVFVLPACDSAEEHAIGGTYSGVTNTQDGLEASLRITIPETESGASFTFTGTFTQFGETYPASGTGTYDHPDVELGVEDDLASGTVSDGGATLTFDDDTGLGVFVLRRE